MALFVVDLSSDTISASDAGVVERVSYAADAVVVGDSIEAINYVVQDVLTSDAIVLADQALTSTAYSLTVSDSITVTDQVTLNSEYATILGDTIGLTEAYLLVETAFPQDVVSVTDQANPATAYEKTFSDTISFTDATTATFEVAVLVADTAAVADQTTVDFTLGRLATDTVAVAEQLDLDTSYVRFGQDAILVLDQALPSQDYSKTLTTDAATVTDLVTVDLFLDEGASDPVAITDTLAIQADYVRFATETVAASDQADPYVDFARVAAPDAISTGDFVLVEREREMIFNETISMAADAIKVDLDYALSANDLATVLDDVFVRVLNNSVEPVFTAAPAPFRTFRYLQPLGLGDLSLHFNRLIPVAVYYTLYQISKSGVPRRVGGRKKAIYSPLGDFYVVGEAGQLGQPGQWLIRWEVQSTYSTPVRIVEQRFQVLDAANSPTDTTPRVAKYGWE